MLVERNLRQSILRPLRGDRRIRGGCRHVSLEYDSMDFSGVWWSIANYFEFTLCVATMNLKTILEAWGSILGSGKPLGGGWRTFLVT